MTELTPDTTPILVDEKPRIEGPILLDASGETIAILRSAAFVKRAASLVSGVVLEGGLGFGQTRAALLASESVESVQTVEILASLPEAIGVDSSEVTVADVQDVIGDAVSADSTPWTSAIFDLDPTGVYDDDAFRSGLAAAFPALGARVVLISDSDDVELPGFHRGLTERFEDENGIVYVHAFDRFDPAAGIGELHPFGDVYIPGRGWRTYERGSDEKNGSGSEGIDTPSEG